jgi:hypothetical protein
LLLVIGKHASDIDKAAFLVHLQYVYQAEAARSAGISKQTTADLKNCTAELEIKHAENGLPLPTLAEMIARKPGSRAKPKITDEEVIQLIDTCTLNKKQRKKL